MTETYFSMHNHSQFSFQDGYASPKEYLDRAKEIGLKGFAITEHGNQCSWVYFDELKKQYPEVKMVYGVEFYEALDGNIKDNDNRYYHLLAIAINEEGRKALNWLVSESQKYFYFKPRVDLNLFRRCFELFDSESIVISSACLQAKLSREKDFKKCIEYIKEYKEVFPYFYLEMQSHSHQDQSDYNQKILMLATTTHTPYIITTDSHASTKEDLYYQARHVQIAHDSETMSESYEGCYLQTVQEIHEIMDGQIGEEAVDKGLKETLNILKLCDDVDMPWQSPQLPDFPIPEGFENEEEYIRHLIFDIGWKSHKCDTLPVDIQVKYKQRLEYELGVIKNMGFVGYFLIVWEFINWAKNNNIQTGTGRGCLNSHTIIKLRNNAQCFIKNVQIGDEVLGADGKYHEVLKVFEYDIYEPTISIEFNRKFIRRLTCTIDHKILIYRNNKEIYVPAKDVKEDDLLCSCYIGDECCYYYTSIKKIYRNPYKKQKVYDLMIADEPSFTAEGIIIHNSGAGSLTNYLLDICNLDPLQYDLIFERFLNPERVSLPDIDTDFNNRKPVIEHMQEIYGYDKVAQVINYSYITNVVAIKDAGRLLKLPYSVVQQISKRFNYDTWEECMEHNPNILEEYPEYYDLFDIASHLSGRVRQASTHAGGVVVSKTVLSDYMGTIRGSEGEIVIEADKRYCEPIGLIKFDLLAVSTLNILKCCQETAGISEWEINPNNPKFLEDSAMFDLIGTGRTNAVFQIESAGMKDLVKRIKPRTIQELSHIIALYRPDSMPMLEDYVARVTGQAPIEYWCPEVEPILKSTCGCLIYQEQTMQIVKDLGNRTYGGADRMRKCLAKKNPAKVKEETDLLRKEMAEQHHSQETIDTICSYLEKMGNYSFNKSHSMAYAVLAMQTAYLKAHYPLHFFNALLKLNEEDYSNINKYILDAKSFGVEVIQPNINQSDKSFRIYQDKIMFGLLPIVGVGDKLATSIIEERETNGKFKGMQDFISRVKVTQAQVVNLIKSGALPTKNKKESLINYAKSLFNASEFKPVSTLPTLKTLKEKFGIDTDVIKDKEERLRLYNNIKKIEFNKAQQEKFEKHMNIFYDKYLQNEDFWQFETLSIFIDSNPFDEAYEYLTPLDEVECGTKCVMAGVIANVQKKKDRYKNDFAFLNIYSSYGITEVTCWSGQFKKYDTLIKRGSQVTILCDKQEDGSYFVKEMKPYQEWLQFMKDKRKVVRR